MPSHYTMSIGPITNQPMGEGISHALSLDPGQLNPANHAGPVKKASDPGDVARQFEAILVRQMLSESMKSVLDRGKEGQVYGYYISEALADGITKGGGLGLRSILETQLRQQAPAQTAGNPEATQGQAPGSTQKK